MSVPEQPSVTHENPHFDPDTGGCWCECAECTSAAENLCLCPVCPGGCDMEHPTVKSARLRAEAARLIAQADALEARDSQGAGEPRG